MTFTVQYFAGTGFDHYQTKYFINDMVEKGEIVHMGSTSKHGALITIFDENTCESTDISIGHLKYEEAVEKLRPYINMNV